MTQLSEARKGNVTEAIKAVAEEENLPLDTLLQLISQGKVVIPF